MSAAAWATLAVAALIILFAAVGLLCVILRLRHVRRTLGSVLGGVTLSLMPVHDFCETV